MYLVSTFFLVVVIPLIAQAAPLSEPFTVPPAPQLIPVTNTPSLAPQPPLPPPPSLPPPPPVTSPMPTTLMPLGPRRLARPPPALPPPPPPPAPPANPPSSPPPNKSPPPPGLPNTPPPPSPPPQSSPSNTPTPPLPPPNKSTPPPSPSNIPPPPPGSPPPSSINPPPPPGLSPNNSTSPSTPSSNEPPPPSATPNTPPPQTCTKPVAARERLHSLAKRDFVCGSNFRAGVDKSSCLPKGTGFSLTPPSTITQISVSALPDDTLQCDHTIELQLLDNVLQTSGMCQIIKALVDAGGATKSALLTPAFDTISSIENINFLDATVNNRKRIVIARSFKGQCQDATDLDKATGNYLQKTKDESEKVANELDSDVNKILAQAKSKLSTLPDGARRSTAARIKTALNDAINGFKSTVTVKATWDKVLADTA